MKISLIVISVGGVIRRGKYIHENAEENCVGMHADAWVACSM